MQPDNTPRKPTRAAAIASVIQAINAGEQLAFSPAEFARSCGRHKCWGYRKIYQGRVKVIRDCGRLLIPVAEVRRFLDDTVIYNGKPAIAAKAATIST